MEGEKNACQEDTRVLLMRVIQSRSLETNSSPKFPVKVNGSQTTNARTIKTQNTHKLMPSIVKVPNKSGKGANHPEDDNKPNIRASSVPRPRAVLSSPDNDGMIGNINRRLSESQATPKTQTLAKSTPMERKPSRLPAELKPSRLTITSVTLRKSNPLV